MTHAENSKSDPLVGEEMVDETPVVPPVSPQDRLLRQGGSHNLKGRAVRGGAMVLAAQVAKFVIQFGGIVVLSRMLGPAELGLVAMVTAFTGLGIVLKDAGLSQATVQRPVITQGQVSALFWLNAAIGLAIAAIVCCLAPVLAWFYHDHRLVNVTLVVSLQFVFAGSAVQHTALLNRDMQFHKLALIEIGSMALGVCVGIVMAWKGCSYWALVATPVVTSLTATLITWAVSGWRPSLPRRAEGVREMLSMGGNQASYSVVNYIARNLDNALIGWWWGPASLGLYSRAYSLFTLPINQIHMPLAQVAISGMSRAQDDPPRFASYFGRAAALLLSLTTPLTCLTIVAAPEVIELALGRQWMGCVSIFRWLAPSGILQPLSNAVGWTYIATGKTDVLLRWGMFQSGCYCLSFLVGLPFGALGVAISYTIAANLLFWPCIVWATRNTPISADRLLRTVAPPVVSSVVAALVSAVMKAAFFQGMRAFPCLAATTLVMLASYAIMLLGVFGQGALYTSYAALLFEKNRAQKTGA